MACTACLTVMCIQDARMLENRLARSGLEGTHLASPLYHVQQDVAGQLAGWPHAPHQHMHAQMLSC
jgi:hypothetical protein